MRHPKTKHLPKSQVLLESVREVIDTSQLFLPVSLSILLLDLDFIRVPLKILNQNSSQWFSWNAKFLTVLLDRFPEAATDRGTNSINIFRNPDTQVPTQL